MPQLGLHGEHDPALGRPVELGEHDARELGGLAELTGLGEAVLAGRRVDDEQRLGDRAGALVGDPAHLAQLLHQVRLGVQSAGRVGEDEIEVTRRGPLDGVEHDGAGVAALATPDELDAGPLGPRRQLLGGRGAERVAGGEQHAATGGDLLVGDLADARRLADAVDADEQPDVGPAFARRSAASGRRRRGAPSSPGAGRRGAARAR